MSEHKLSLADLRENYMKGGLDIIDVEPDPFLQFHDWMDEAIATGIVDANAMTLSTADGNGIPSARIVLLKHYDEHGFCFFTNYTSRKGVDLAQNPHAALVFHWKELERQVCIRGKVRKVSREESETYFHMRPHASQLGAMASYQSHVIPNREVLEEREQALLREFPEGETIPLPDYWGGYRLEPEYIEFWQGRPSRLHDRIVYTLQSEDNWTIDRFSP